MSSAKPAAIFAIRSAEAGATMTKSADCARSMCAIRPVSGSSNTPVSTGFRVRARSAASPMKCVEASVMTA